MFRAGSYGGGDGGDGGGVGDDRNDALNQGLRVFGLEGEAEEGGRGVGQDDVRINYRDIRLNKPLGYSPRWRTQTHESAGHMSTSHRSNSPPGTLTVPRHPRPHHHHGRMLHGRVHTFNAASHELRRACARRTAKALGWGAGWGVEVEDSEGGDGGWGGEGGVGMEYDGDGGRQCLRYAWGGYEDDGDVGGDYRDDVEDDVEVVNDGCAGPQVGMSMNKLKLNAVEHRDADGYGVSMDGVSVSQPMHSDSESMNALALLHTVRQAVHARVMRVLGTGARDGDAAGTGVPTPSQRNKDTTIADIGGYRENGGLVLTDDDDGEADAEVDAAAAALLLMSERWQTLELPESAPKTQPSDTWEQ